MLSDGLPHRPDLHLVHLDPNVQLSPPPGEATQEGWPGILTSAEFMAAFGPLDYIIDGIFLRRYLYSLTGRTGSGKTAITLLVAASVARGKPFAGRYVSQGRVLYLAGENPTDVQMRWDAMAAEMDFDTEGIDVYFISGIFNIEKLIDRVNTEVQQIGGVEMVIVDTSAAYFHGEQENENTQLGAHARHLRSLTQLPGGPCVIANCHPTKSASNDELVPRGGGAFLAEVDGNLTCARDGNVLRLHWQGKFRGPDFDPLSFELETVDCRTLRDSKGRLLPTVIARALSDQEEAQREESARSDEDTLLLAMRDQPGSSIEALRKAVSWGSKSKVDRVMKRLRADKLVELVRGHWQLTKRGKEEAAKAETSE